MTHALGDQPPQDDAAARLSARAARLARLVELTSVLHAAARCAAERHGAAYLLVDRTAGDTPDIRVLVEHDRLVDLWQLDPLLWDDVHRAAVALVEPGEVRIVRPDVQPD